MHCLASKSAEAVDLSVDSKFQHWFSEEEWILIRAARARPNPPVNTPLTESYSSQYDASEPMVSFSILMDVLSRDKTNLDLERELRADPVLAPYFVQGPVTLTKKRKKGDISRTNVDIGAVLLDEFRHFLGAEVAQGSARHALVLQLAILCSLDRNYADLQRSIALPNAPATPFPLLCLQKLQERVVPGVAELRQSLQNEQYQVGLPVNYHGAPRAVLLCGSAESPTANTSANDRGTGGRANMDMDMDGSASEAEDSLRAPTVVSSGPVEDGLNCSGLATVVISGISISGASAQQWECTEVAAGRSGMTSVGAGDGDGDGVQRKRVRKTPSPRTGAGDQAAVDAPVDARNAASSSGGARLSCRSRVDRASSRNRRVSTTVSSQMDTADTGRSAAVSTDGTLSPNSSVSSYYYYESTVRAPKVDEDFLYGMGLFSDGERPPFLHACVGWLGVVTEPSSSEDATTAQCAVLYDGSLNMAFVVTSKKQLPCPQLDLSVILLANCDYSEPVRDLVSVYLRSCSNPVAASAAAGSASTPLEHLMDSARNPALAHTITLAAVQVCYLELLVGELRKLDASQSGSGAGSVALIEGDCEESLGLHEFFRESRYQESSGTSTRMPCHSLSQRKRPALFDFPWGQPHQRSTRTDAAEPVSSTIECLMGRFSLLCAQEGTAGKRRGLLHELVLALQNPLPSSNNAVRVVPGADLTLSERWNAGCIVSCCLDPVSGRFCFFVNGSLAISSTVADILNVPVVAQGASGHRRCAGSPSPRPKRHLTVEPEVSSPSPPVSLQRWVWNPVFRGQSVDAAVCVNIGAVPMDDGALTLHEKKFKVKGFHFENAVALCTGARNIPVVQAYSPSFVRINHHAHVASDASGSGEPNSGGCLECPAACYFGVDAHPKITDVTKFCLEFKLRLPSLVLSYPSSVPGGSVSAYESAYEQCQSIVYYTSRGDSSQSLEELMCVWVFFLPTTGQLGLYISKRDLSFERQQARCGNPSVPDTSYAFLEMTDVVELVHPLGDEKWHHFAVSVGDHTAASSSSKSSSVSRPASPGAGAEWSIDGTAIKAMDVGANPTSAAELSFHCIRTSLEETEADLKQVQYQLYLQESQFYQQMDNADVPANFPGASDGLKNKCRLFIGAKIVSYPANEFPTMGSGESTAGDASGSIVEESRDISSHFYSGDMAELRVWAATRSLVDICATLSKDSLFTKVACGLLSCWQFSEGRGELVYNCAFPHGIADSACVAVRRSGQRSAAAAAAADVRNSRSSTLEWRSFPCSGYDSSTGSKKQGDCDACAVLVQKYAGGGALCDQLCADLGSLLPRVDTEAEAPVSESQSEPGSLLSGLAIAFLKTSANYLSGLTDGSGHEVVDSVADSDVGGWVRRSTREFGLLVYPSKVTFSLINLNMRQAIALLCRLKDRRDAYADTDGDSASTLKLRRSLMGISVALLRMLRVHIHAMPRMDVSAESVGMLFCNSVSEQQHAPTVLKLFQCLVFFVNEFGSSGVDGIDSSVHEEALATIESCLGLLFATGHDMQLLTHFLAYRLVRTLHSVPSASVTDTGRFSDSNTVGGVSCGDDFSDIVNGFVGSGFVAEYNKRESAVSAAISTSDTLWDQVCSITAPLDGLFHFSTPVFVHLLAVACAESNRGDCITLRTLCGHALLSTNQLPLAAPFHCIGGNVKDISFTSSKEIPSQFRLILTPSIGDLVVRGPDWVYGQQDSESTEGTESVNDAEDASQTPKQVVGMIVDIIDWTDANTKCGLVVRWPAGHCNVYCYGGRRLRKSDPPSGPENQTATVHDVSIFKRPGRSIVGEVLKWRFHRFIGTSPSDSVGSCAVGIDLLDADIIRLMEAELLSYGSSAHASGVISTIVYFITLLAPLPWLSKRGLLPDHGAPGRCALTAKAALDLYKSFSIEVAADLTPIRTQSGSDSKGSSAGRSTPTPRRRSRPPDAASPPKQLRSMFHKTTSEPSSGGVRAGPRCELHKLGSVEFLTLLVRLTEYLNENSKNGESFVCDSDKKCIQDFTILLQSVALDIVRSVVSKEQFRGTTSGFYRPLPGALSASGPNSSESRAAKGPMRCSITAASHLRNHACSSMFRGSGADGKLQWLWDGRHQILHWGKPVNSPSTAAGPGLSCPQRSLSTNVELKFPRQSRTSPLVVDCDNGNVQLTGMKGWTTVVCTNEISPGTGLHAWAVKIDRLSPNQGQISLGLVSSEFSASSVSARSSNIPATSCSVRLGFDAHSWGICSSDSMCYHNKIASSSKPVHTLSGGGYGNRRCAPPGSDRDTSTPLSLTRGVVLKFVMDTNTGELFVHIYRNVEELRRNVNATGWHSDPVLLFTGLHGLTLSPAVSLYCAGDAVSAISLGKDRHLRSCPGPCSGVTDKTQLLPLLGPRISAPAESGIDIESGTENRVFLGCPSSSFMAYTTTVFQASERMLRSYGGVDADGLSLVDRAANAMRCFKSGFLCTILVQTIGNLLSFQYMPVVHGPTAALDIQRFIQLMHSIWRLVESYRLVVAEYAGDDGVAGTYKESVDSIGMFACQLSYLLGGVLGRFLGNHIEGCYYQLSNIHVVKREALWVKRMRQMYQAIVPGGSVDEGLACLPAVNHTANDPVLTGWLRSPLFRHGLTNAAASSKLVLTPGNRVSSRSRSDSFSSYATPRKSLLMVGGEVPLTPSQTSVHVSALMELLSCSFIETDSNTQPRTKAGVFFSWLMCHDKIHRAYRNLGGASLNGAVVAVFCAVVYHAGYAPLLYHALGTVEKELSGDAESSSWMSEPLPQALLEAWSSAVKIKDCVNRSEGYDVSGFRWFSRAVFTLEFEQWHRDKDTANADIFGSHAAGPASPARAFGHAHTHTVMRSNSQELHQVRMRDEIRQVASVLKAFVLDSRMGARVSLVYVAADTILMQAMAKQFAYKCLRQVVGVVAEHQLGAPSPVDCVVKSVVLFQIPAALRCEFGNVVVGRVSKAPPEAIGVVRSVSGWSSLWGASACIPRGIGMSLRGARESFLCYLVEELASYQADSVSCDYVLTLLNCWGQGISEADHDMLVRVNLFGVLQDLYDSATDLSIDCSAPSAPSLEGQAVHASLGTAAVGVTKWKVVAIAVIKLTYLLAQQIAVAEDKSSGAEDSLRSSQFESPVLRRAPSGPSTLSSAVFDMICSQLFTVCGLLDHDVAMACLSEGDNSLKVVHVSQELSSLLLAATSLLVNVVHTAQCRRMLCNLKWVTVLLRLSLLGPEACRLRALRLLAEILPSMPQLVSKSDGETLDVATSERRSFDINLLQRILLCKDKLDSEPNEVLSLALINRLLELAIKQHGGHGPDGDTNVWVRVEEDRRESWKSVPKLRPPALPKSSLDNGTHCSSYVEAMTSVSSEAIALVRALMQSEHWSAITSKVLIGHLLVAPAVLRGLEGGSEDQCMCELVKLSACVKVLGGHVDQLYDGCLVAVSERPGVVAPPRAVVTGGNVFPFHSSDVSGTNGLQTLTVTYVDAHGKVLSTDCGGKTVSVNADCVKPLNMFPLSRLNGLSPDLLAALFQAFSAVMSDVGTPEGASSSKPAGHSGSARASTRDCGGNDAFEECKGEDVDALREEKCSDDDDGCSDGSGSSPVDAGLHVGADSVSKQDSESDSDSNRRVADRALLIRRNDLRCMFSKALSELSQCRNIVSAMVSSLSNSTGCSAVLQSLLKFSSEDVKRSCGGVSEVDVFEYYAHLVSVETCKIGFANPVQNKRTGASSSSMSNSKHERSRAMDDVSESKGKTPDFSNADDDKVALMEHMGFSRSSCQTALELTNGDVDCALNLIRHHRDALGRVMTAGGSSYDISTAASNSAAETPKDNSEPVAMDVETPTAIDISEAYPADSLIAGVLSSANWKQWSSGDRIEDRMETPGGCSNFQKQNRFFRSHYGSSVYCKRDGSNSYVTADTPSASRSAVKADEERRNRVMGSPSLSRVWQFLTAVSTSLTNLNDITLSCTEALVTLHCRKALLVLILFSFHTCSSEAWKIFSLNLLGSGSGEVVAPGDCADSKRQCVQFVRFIRIITFRGNPFTTDELNNRSLMALIHGDLAALQLELDCCGYGFIENSLRKAVLALLGAHVDPTAACFSVTQITIWGELLCSINSNLVMAALASDSAEPSHACGTRRDSELGKYTNLTYTNFMSFLLMDAVETVVTNGEFQLHDKFVAVAVLLVRMWINALRSSSMSLRHLVMQTLTKLVSTLLDWINRVREDHSVGKGCLLDALRQCVDFMPLERLRNMCGSRLRTELEDFPIYSRYFQSLFELVATAERAKCACGGVAAVTVATVRESPAPISQVDETVPEHGEDMVVLSMQASSKVHISQAPLKGPWTVECWLFRHSIAEKKTDPRPDATGIAAESVDEATSALDPEDEFLDDDTALIGELSMPPISTLNQDSLTENEISVESESSSADRGDYNNMARSLLASTSAIRNRNASSQSQQPPNSSGDGFLAALLGSGLGPGVGSSGAMALHLINRYRLGGPLDPPLPSAEPSFEPDIESSGYFAERPGSRRPPGASEIYSDELGGAPDELDLLLQTFGGSSRSLGDGARALGRSRGRSIPALMQRLTGRVASSDSTSGGRSSGDSGVKRAGRKSEGTDARDLVPSVYLLSGSDGGFIKVQAGGRVVRNPAEGSADSGTPAEPFCLSFGHISNESYSFDYVMPCDRWVHLAITSTGTQLNSDSMVTLFADGEEVDAISAKFSLPFSAIGYSAGVSLPFSAVGYSAGAFGDSNSADSSKQSFAGQIGGLRVWMAAKSRDEIKRDMSVSFEEPKGLLADIRLLRPAPSVRGCRSVVDEMQLISSCKLSEDCSWVPLKRSEPSPIMKPFSLPKYFVTSSVEEGEGVFGDYIDWSSDTKSPGSNHVEASCSQIYELTGSFRLDAGRDCFRKVAVSTVEVVMVSFVAASFSQDAPTCNISGYLEWCSRKCCRSRISGTWNRTTDSFNFSTGKDDVVLGPPEELGWFDEIEFSCSIADDASLVGTAVVSKWSQPIPYLLPGESRVCEEDAPYCVSFQAAPASTSAVSTSSAPSSVPVVLTIQTDVKIAQHKVTVESMPLCRCAPTGGDGDIELAGTNKYFGICASEGSLWVSWSVVKSASNRIVFGVCTAAEAIFEFEFHGSRSVANAWYITQSGMSYCSQVKADPFFSHIEASFAEGDEISVQIDADCGTFTFYRNNRAISQLKCNPRDSFSPLGVQQIHPLITPPPEENFTDIDTRRGLRPFVCLRSSGDSVSYLGDKKGYVKLIYPARKIAHTLSASAAPIDNDNSECGESSSVLCSFEGCLANGRFNGVGCLVAMLEDSKKSAIVEWWGLWKDGKKDGIHYLCPHKADSASMQTESTASDTPILAYLFQGGTNKGLVDFVSTASTGSASAAGLDATADVDIIRYQQEHLQGEFAGEIAKYAAELKKLCVEEEAHKPKTQTEDPDTLTLSTVMSSLLCDKDDSPLFLAPDTGCSVVERISKGVITEGRLVLRTEGECERCASERSERWYKVAGGYTCVDSTGGFGFSLAGEKYVRPLKFLVIRDGGAKVRAQPALGDTSVDVGTIPPRTVVSVDERRRYTTEVEGDIWRMHVDSPDQYQGWISEKEHIVTPVLDPCRCRPTSAVPSARVRDEPCPARSPFYSPTHPAYRPVEPVTSSQSAESQELLNAREHVANSSAESAHEKAVALRRIEVRARADRIQHRCLLNPLYQHQGAPDRAIRGYRRIKHTRQAHLDVSTEHLFLLSRKIAGSNTSAVKISADFTSISHLGGSDRCAAVGSRGFSKGIHYWEVAVENAGWGSVYIGVCPPEASGWSGYGVMNYRATLGLGMESLYGSYFAAGDTVGVLLDMDHGTLSFFKEGEDFNRGKCVVINMGVAYSNIRRNQQAMGKPGTAIFFPCLGVKSGGDKLSLRSSRWLSQKGMNLKAQLDMLTVSRAVLQSHYNRLTLRGGGNEEYVDMLFDSYAAWKRSSFQIFVSRTEMKVAVDTSAISISALGNSIPFLRDKGITLSYGTEFTTKFGRGKIIGVRGQRIADVSGDNCRYGATISPQLWFMSLGDVGQCTGAWFWPKSQLNAYLTSEIIKIQPMLNRAPSTGTFGAEEACDPIDGSSDVVLTASKEEFVRCLGVDAWSLAEEESLVRMVNEYSACWQCEPLSIPPKELLRTWHAAMGVGFSAGSISASSRSPSNEDRTKSDLQVETKYMQICALNRAAAAVLPLADFGLRHQPMVSTVFNEQSTDTCASSLATELRFLKGLVFMRTKLDLWHAALRETTTYTSVPGDEYEKPDEMREIVINRLGSKHYLSSLPMASESRGGDGGLTAALRHYRQLPEALKTSVFGQLLESLKGMDDGSLRRAYVYMLDAGQARGFFVKLTGEGADDNGGPYRAVFQTVLEEEVERLLHLVVPSANAEEGSGRCRDQVVLNPVYMGVGMGVSPAAAATTTNTNTNRSTDLTLAKLYHHLGRLMGMCCRHGIDVPLSLPALIWKPLVTEPLSETDMESVDIHGTNAVRTLMSSSGGIDGCGESAEGETEEQESRRALSLQLFEQHGAHHWLFNNGTSIPMDSVSSTGPRSGSAVGVEIAGSPLGGMSSGCLDHMQSLLRAKTSRTNPAVDTADDPQDLQMHRVDGVRGPADDLCRLVMRMQLTHHSPGLFELHRGLAAVLPTELWGVFTPVELELLVCGQSEVDIDRLERATFYSDGISPTDRYASSLKALFMHAQSLSFSNCCIAFAGSIVIYCCFGRLCGRCLQLRCLHLSTSFQVVRDCLYLKGRSYI